jgi:hypothetical protein
MKNALETFIDDLRAAWGPLTTETVARCERLLAVLTRAPETESWLEPLLRERPAGKELYRDPDHGFLLLTHAEQRGTYRVPHDHGSGWVIYAVQHGEIEMGSYARVLGVDGQPYVVRRDVGLLRAGDVRVYLPGDIHDTHCVSDEVRMLRFTSVDLKVEEREGRMKRYADSCAVSSAARRAAIPAAPPRS